MYRIQIKPPARYEEVYWVEDLTADIWQAIIQHLNEGGPKTEIHILAFENQQLPAPDLVV